MGDEPRRGRKEGSVSKSINLIGSKMNIKIDGFLLTLSFTYTCNDIHWGSGGRVVRALSPAAPRSSLCGVLGSSPIAARYAALPSAVVSVTELYLSSDNCIYDEWGK